MPNRKAAVKRLRVDKKRHQRNLKIKTELKKGLKKLQALLTAKNSAEAKTSLAKVFSLLDKAAKKKILHPNTANRKKGRLAKKVLKAA
ncbi:MAG: 30S ribosomal protein S20 [Candidatus Omnitrophica bacterium]|jgi:small subunit ribosomal protein S20|nr:30S ribosomal protein S20 [Candidatus Omnitrophota bacterium]MDD5079433.1 30S ribosomal protein S20 [Candidatus Omnitrophota bacterium]